MKKFIIIALIAGPMFAYAALDTLYTSIQAVGGIIGTLVPLMMALAVVAFFWGLVKYISNANDEAAKEGGKTLMIWGMIALFIMVALWSILGWVQNNLGITGTVTAAAPPTVYVPK